MAKTAAKIVVIRPLWPYSPRGYFDTTKIAQ
jgi:hypothetical protein